MINQPKILIYGNASMARVVFSYVRREQEVAGFVVDDHCIEPGCKTFCGLPLIPFSRITELAPPAEVSVLMAIGFLEMNRLRERKVGELKEKGYSIAGYIDKNIRVHDDVSFGEGVILLEHISIHPGCRIGDGVFIAGNVNIGHDCILGDYAWLCGGVCIAGNTAIGGGSFLGINASVANDLVIGRRNFIGANTLLNISTGDNAVYISGRGEKFPLESPDFLRFSRIL